MNNPAPTAYLPHGNSFLFIDRIVSREAGTCASGIKCVTHEPCSYPQVFLLESMAQLGGIAAGQEGEGGFLAAVEHAEFTRGIRAGECILISVRIVKSFGRLLLLEGEATVDGEKVAGAVLTLGIGTI
jgi:3-hydroxyacyl-[acyl-carrier-protein] dehydratase